MIIDLNELNYKKQINIDADVNFEQLINTIKKVNNAHFKGLIFINAADELKLEGDLKATLVLYDAVDLSDYDYPIDINIDEILDLKQKTLDINEILWENIVLEVPIRVTKHDSSNLKGEGWEVKNEKSKDNEIDPRLEKLQELFKGGE